MQSLQHARFETPQIRFEWHVLDDASKDHPKAEMLKDLVQRKWLANYTRLPRHVGTVGALRHVVDTFLQREDLDLFLHCDDDILMGETTLSRAVLDYVRLSKTFTQPGGVLALFVNSWCLDRYSFNHSTSNQAVELLESEPQQGSCDVYMAAKKPLSDQHVLIIHNDNKIYSSDHYIVLLLLSR